MPRIRTIIFLLLLAWGFWHFYGDIWKQAGFQGVYDDIRTDINQVSENPTIHAVVDTINQEFQRFMGMVQDNIGEDETPNEPMVEKPELQQPTEQEFSINNIEIGDIRSEVEAKVGEPKRASENEYGVDWVAYHENYQNFFMVAYDDKDQVAGLYTNQDLVSSTHGISLESTQEEVLAAIAEEPLDGIRKGLVTYQLDNNQEYDIFLMDDNYITIFYDKHENKTVTAIQIISKELEQEKKAYFGEPNDDLKQGFEYQLFDLTNAARVNHGLPVLSWAEPVRQTARDHSTDMAVNNYFSHTNQEGQSPFDRMTEDAISYTMAGENLAAGQPSSIFAHEGLMNSLGHRENKLHTGFEALAVGVAFNEDDQPYYTENYLSN
ncbi:serine protease [Oceanobacillus piezotolerans]|uniref:Serine protease n=1 Tax=Oceanobacillus piezotolerans TaxID=2448030 RepID=A0A498D5A5_9BACI|nr:CAP-associated domain-containing protein [Oceanobacillus piezotolerans]RLL44859.1 serine protease [Oceanobacillus piezotolerans]